MGVAGGEAGRESDVERGVSGPGPESSAPHAETESAKRVRLNQRTAVDLSGCEDDGIVGTRDEPTMRVAFPAAGSADNDRGSLGV